MANRGNSPSGFDRISHDYGKIRPKILLAVMGVTGAGKSSFINVANGGSRVTNTSLEPSTEYIEKTRPLAFGNADVVLVDTPGFDRIETPDISVLDQFVQFLKEAREENLYLTGIIYLHRITDIRMSSSATHNIQLLRILCGDQFLPRVTMVTTMWDSVKQRVGEHREHELKDTFWAEIIARGGVYSRYDGTQEGARRIIERYLDAKFMSEIGIVKSSIERQVIDSHAPLRETLAGQFALEKLREKVQQYEQKLDQMREMRVELDYDSLEFEAAQILEEIRKGEKELEGYKKMLEGSGPRLASSRIATPEPSGNRRSARKTKNSGRSQGTSLAALEIHHDADGTATWNGESQTISGNSSDQSQYPYSNPQRESDYVTDQLAESISSKFSMDVTSESPPTSEEYWTWDARYNRWYHRNEDGSSEWAG